MGIHLRIYMYKDSPNSTEFQGMNRTPFFDPKKGVPYPAVRPQSGSDGDAVGKMQSIVWTTKCIQYTENFSHGNQNDSVES